jgi:DNA helicase-2/ATP-dependent DNA helicase PcrA
VFTDATLTAIARHRPTRGTELAGLPGVGATKLDKFGAEVLALVAGG